GLQSRAGAAPPAPRAPTSKSGPTAAPPPRDAAAATGAGRSTPAGGADGRTKKRSARANATYGWAARSTAKGAASGVVSLSPRMTADARVVRSSDAYLLLARNVRSPGSARSIAAMRRISMVPSPSRRHPSCCAMSLSFKRLCLSYHLLPDALERSRVFGADLRPSRGLPRPDDDAGGGGDRATELAIENRLHAHEELLEVIVVVERLAGGGRRVGLEDRVDLRVAVEQHGERELARVGGRRRRRRRE